jgi:putative DNA primase/helicase
MTGDPKVKGRKRSKPTISKEDAEKLLDELVGMSLPEYGERRFDIAEAIGLPTGLLDAEFNKRRRQAGGIKATDDFPTAEPVTYPVDGDDLLQEIVDIANRHLVLPHGAAEIIAAWSVFTYCCDSFDISPILTITSPTPECGKTTLLSILGMVANKPLPASNVTAAALFRAVDKWKPTLLIDEGDTFIRESDELRGILNSGHHQKNAFVIRCDGENLDPKRFSTWCPKAIALIGKLHPTLASRSIHIKLKRKLPGQWMVPIRGRNYNTDIQPKAARWAEDHGRQLSMGDAVLPDAIHGRAADNWRPLIRIADAAGGDWRERLLKIAERYCASESDDDHLVTLLHDVISIFETKGTDRLSSEEIVEALNDMEHRPWPEWKNGKPISKPQLARLLSRLDVTSGSIRLASGKTPKGYYRDAFSEVLTHYPIPETPEKTATPPQDLALNELRDFRSATPDLVVAVSNAEKSQDSNGCGGVAVSNPSPGVGGGDNDPFATLKDYGFALQPKRCTACDGLGCPHCKPEGFGLPPKQRRN